LKKLDLLVIKEIIGPWAFGVALFGSLLFAATWLGRVAEYIAGGLPADMVWRFAILLLPAILVQTFAMSSLLGSLLAFGRLSSDSEVVAIRAAGVSLFRMIMPVSAFSLVVAAAAFALNEIYVPIAAKQSQVLANEIAEQLDKNVLSTTVVPIKKEGKLQAMVMAKDFSPDGKTLRGVTIVSYLENGDPSAYLYAEALTYTNPESLREGRGWRISGGAEMLSADGSDRYVVDSAWPEEFVEPSFSPADILSRGLKSFESLSMGELGKKIRDGIDDPTVSRKDLRNYEYGYWNKISLPLAAFIFGTLGAALGIRNHRTGTAAGFALAVAIIFGYFTLANFMNVWALSGKIPPYVASFSPIAIGFIASVVIIWRRNA
jgi:lipopolysaccharide export system permease protein